MQEKKSDWESQISPHLQIFGGQLQMLLMTLGHTQEKSLPCHCREERPSGTEQTLIWLELAHVLWGPAPPVHTVHVSDTE